MIGYLHGKIVEKKPPGLMIDVGGIGYEVEAPMTTFADLPELGHNTLLYTHLIIREDCQLLFGFSDQHQRSLFRTLIKVSGVGAKMAIAILSSIEPDGFARCVQADDVQTLTRLPGIGRKIAERLVIEMRDKLKDWSYSAAEIDDSASGPAAPESSPALQEATDALIALGYKPQEAKRAVSKVSESDGSDDAETLIRQALKGNS